MGHAHVQNLRFEMLHGPRARANFAFGNERAPDERSSIDRHDYCKIARGS